MPELRRLVAAAETAARDGWNDADVSSIVVAAEPLRIEESELARLLQLERCDHGLREEILATSDAFHASIFALAAGETIPLHDHPSLNVVCKVLRGRMRVRTYEWIDADSLVARDCGEQMLSDAGTTLVLRSSPGTLHTITTLEPTAFLDLFAPYYDDEARPCRYYIDDGRRNTANVATLRRVTWEEAHR